MSGTPRGAVWRLLGPAPPLGSAGPGRVVLSGGKNAALPLMLAAAGAPGASRLLRLPTGLTDVDAAATLLRSAGCVLGDSPSAGGVADGPAIRSTPVLLAALAGRHGVAETPAPGGCAIGERSIRLHLEVMRAFGLDAREEGPRLRASGQLRPTRLQLPFPSTTASQVAIVCAALAPGASRLTGLNLRAENLGLLAALAAAGAEVRVTADGAEIVGPLARGLDVTVPATADEALTWLIASLITGGALEVEAAGVDDAQFAVLEAAGATLERVGQSVFRAALLAPRPFSLRFGEPGGPGSDLHPLLAALALVLPGVSELVDIRFPQRTAYVEGLRRLGADVTLAAPGVVRVRGPAPLHGGAVDAADLRGGAALLLAALVARGPVALRGVEQLERGYEALPARLRSLGVGLTVV